MCSAPSIPAMPEPPTPLPPAPTPPAPPEPAGALPPPVSTNSQGEDAGKLRAKTSKRGGLQQSMRGVSELRVPLDVGTSANTGTKKTSGVNIPT